MRVLGVRSSRLAVTAGVALAAAGLVLGPVGAAAPEMTATPAGAKPVEEIEGRVVLGTPVAEDTTVHMTVAGCNPGTPLNGVESIIYDVAKYAGHYTDVAPQATLDADLWFFDADCNYLDPADAALAGADHNLQTAALAQVERGYIPPKAAFAELRGVTGAGAFMFTIYDATL